MSADRVDGASAPRRDGSPQTSSALPPSVLAVLAFCGGFAPFAVDTYLPGLPAIAREFHTSASLAQLTLTAFLIPLGLRQLVIGPLSDQIGRKRPMLVGLAGSMVASIVCAVAPSIGVLIAGRALQGAFGAAAIVLARAVVADLGRTPVRIAKAFGIVIAIQSVAPALAPVVGGLIVPAYTWRGVFWFLALLGALLTLAVWFVVPESLPADRRHGGGVPTALGNMGILLRQKEFVAPTLTFWVTFVLMFAYVAGSPFVLQDIAGFSDRGFAVVFAVNSLALVAASITSGRLVGRVGHVRLATFAVALMTVAVLWLMIAVFVLDTAAWAVIPGFFLLVTGNGLLFSLTSSLAVSVAGPRAGAASALLGSGQYVLASASAPLSGLGGGRSAVPMVCIMGVASIAQVSLLLRLRRLARTGAYDTDSD